MLTADQLARIRERNGRDCPYSVEAQEVIRLLLEHIDGLSTSKPSTFSRPLCCPDRTCNPDDACGEHCDVCAWEAKKSAEGTR